MPLMQYDATVADGLLAWVCPIRSGPRVRTLLLEDGRCGKIRKLVITSAALLVAASARASASTYLIDFGFGSPYTTTDTGWNNVTVTGSATTESLVDSTGASSGITLGSSPWYGSNNTTLATGSLVTNSPVGLAFPSTATEDFFYVQAGTAVPAAIVTFTGLGTDECDVSVLASRAAGAGDPSRSGTYSIVGGPSATIDAGGTGQGDTSLVTLSNITPAAADGGTMVLDVAPTVGGTYAYLNAIELDTVPASSTPEPGTPGIAGLAAAGVVGRSRCGVRSRLF